MYNKKRNLPTIRTEPFLALGTVLALLLSCEEQARQERRPRKTHKGKKSKIIAFSVDTVISIFQFLDK